MVDQEANEKIAMQAHLFDGSGHLLAFHSACGRQNEPSTFFAPALFKLN
jgi:hypothetical protein